MDLPVTIVEIVNRIESERVRWDQTIGKLTDAQCLTPDICGHWSVKDVIAHISWFEQQMEWMVSRHSLDGEGTAWWLLPTDERNDKIYHLYQDMPLEAVKTMAQERYAAMLAAIQQLADPDLVEPARYHGMPLDWVPAEIIAQNTWEHYADHLKGIRQAFPGEIG